MKNRIDWVDYAKAIVIILILIIHAQISQPLKAILLSFSNAAFFFYAGMFAKTSRETNFKSFLKNRTLKLLIAYLFINLINYLFWFFIGRGTGVDTTTENPYLPLLGMLYGNAAYLPHYIPIWFISCLISIEILFYFASKIFVNNRGVFVLILLCAALSFVEQKIEIFPLPWELNSVFNAMVYYVMGFVFVKNSIEKRSCKIRDKNSVLIVILTSALVVLCFFARESVENKLVQYAFAILGAISGISAINFFCVILEKTKLPLKWLKFIGVNTLAIFGLHILAMSFIKAITTYIFGLPISIYQNQFNIVLLSFGAIILLVPAILFLNKYFPALVGKPKVR